MVKPSAPLSQLLGCVVQIQQLSATDLERLVALVPHEGEEEAREDDEGEHAVRRHVPEEGPILISGFSFRTR